MLLNSDGNILPIYVLREFGRIAKRMMCRVEAALVASVVSVCNRAAQKCMRFNDV